MQKAALFLLVLAVPFSCAAEKPIRTVVIGDLHGDLRATRLLLRASAVVDAKGHWASNTTRLIQTGDLCDRGPDGPAIFEIFRELRNEAAEGCVVNLIGNHEAMLLCGMRQYVSPTEMRRYYEGDVLRLRADWRPDGPIGRFLRKDFEVFAVHDSVVFVHAGLLPGFASLSPATLKASLFDSVDRRACRDQNPVLNADGPMWTRAWSEDPAGTSCAKLARALEELKAKVMVVGHTPTPTGRFEAGCGGRLLTIDTAISGWMVFPRSSRSFLSIEADGRWFESVVVQLQGDDSRFRLERRELPIRVTPLAEDAREEL